MSPYRNATLPDGSRVVLYARGNDGPAVLLYEVVELRQEGASGLVQVGTVVARARGRASFFLP